ncbi:MAG: apolipoprotein N-acyltransferase [bacterium]|nr:apolipoprotein N-acyltransferase [bacterium]
MAEHSGSSDDDAPGVSWRWLLAAVVSGGLMSVCYWPLDWHVLAWFALVPWLMALPRIPSDRAWLLGTILGLVYYGVGLRWCFGLLGPMGAAVILILALWLGFSFRVAKLLMERFSSSAMLWAVPLAFVGQEVLRSEGLPRLRFAYLAYGYSQSSNLWIAQSASIGGVYSVSLLMLAFNSALARALIGRKRRDWGVVLAVAGVGLGLGLVSQPADEAAGEEVAVACVQAESYSHFDYAVLTAEALEHPSKPKLVVLPEHTIADYADEHHHLVKQLAGLARRYGAYVCVGAHARAAGGAACDYDNVALLIGPSGEIIGSQAKAVPLPFFIDGNPARAHEVFETAFAQMGMCICFDADFTDVTRRVVGLGAEMLLVPVMNPQGWPVQQRWQQAGMAAFRSIEVRRSAVRSASSGVSQIVGADGRVRGQRSGDEGPGVLYGTVRPNDESTLFSRGGHLIATSAGIAYLSVFGWLTVVDWRRKLRGMKLRRSDASVSHG